MKSPGQKGLTLIELIVAIAIAALLLTLAAPGFQLVSAKVKRSSAITSMTGAFHFARGESLKRGEILTLCASSDGAQCAPEASPDWGKGWLLFEDANRNRQVNAGESILRSHDAVPGTYTITGDAGIGKGVLFLSNGFPQLSGTFAYQETHSNSPCAGTLSLSVVGRITVNFNDDNCTW